MCGGKFSGEVFSRQGKAGFLGKFAQGGVEKISVCRFAASARKGDLAAPGVVGADGTASQKDFGLKGTCVSDQDGNGGFGNFRFRHASAAFGKAGNEEVCEVELAHLLLGLLDVVRDAHHLNR